MVGNTGSRDITAAGIRILIVAMRSLVQATETDQWLLARHSRMRIHDSPYMEAFFCEWL